MASVRDFFPGDKLKLRHFISGEYSLYGKNCFLALEILSTLIEFTLTFLFSNLQNSLSTFLV